MTSTTPTPPTLQNALAFAARGHAVFPIYGVINGKCGCGKDCGRDAGKHPHHLAPRGVRNATTDEAAIRSWFRKHPDINYGICTDTLPTVDIDPRHGGDKSWYEMIRKHYDVVGWRVRTGGGGDHIMFGTISETLPSKVGLLKGVDFKGVGGYIIGPGSMHVSGKRYIWDRSAMPGDDPSPQAPPPWLVALVMATKTKPAKERTPEEDAAFFDMLLAPALPGERRARVRQLLGHLFGKPFPHRGVLACLVMSHVKLTYPDLTDFGDKEIEALAKDFIARDDFKRGIAA